MANVARQAVAAAGPAISQGVVSTEESVGFILPALIRLVLERISIQKPAFGHPIKIATIHLQWNRKAKMMPAAKFFAGSLIIRSVEAAAPAITTRIYSNDPRAKTCGEALAAAGGDGIRNCSTGVRTGAEPGPARRDQIAVPLRLHRALLQHPAGW